MSSPINVLLVDDHNILREGLKTLIESDPEVCVTASAGTAAEGLAKAIGSHVQVAVIDFSLPDHDGIWLLQNIRSKRPDLPVIILSMHTDHATVVKALGEGASGYLSKGADSTELLAAIRAVHQGGSYLQPKITSHLIGALRKNEQASAPAEFSARDIQILQRVSEGRSNHDIAAELFVSPSTVKAHLRVLFQKLGASTRTEVVVEALRRGLITNSAS